MSQVDSIPTGCSASSAGPLPSSSCATVSPSSWSAASIPFDVDLPLTGFPEAATLDRPSNQPLTDQFLEDIAREYLSIGRGYARAIAAERHVSERTVVSWVEKARKQGILTRVRPGSLRRRDRSQVEAAPGLTDQPSTV